MSASGFVQAIQNRNKVIVKFYSAPKAKSSEEGFEVAVCFPAQDGALHSREFPHYRKRLAWFAHAGGVDDKTVHVKPGDTLVDRDIKTVIPVNVATPMERTGLYIQGQAGIDDSFEQLRYNANYLVWRKISISPKYWEKDFEDLEPVRWCETVGEQYSVSPPPPPRIRVVSQCGAVYCLWHCH